MTDIDESGMLSPMELLQEQVQVAYGQIDEIKLRLEVAEFRRRITLAAVAVLLALTAVGVALVVRPYEAEQYRELAPAVLTLCVIGLCAAAAYYLQQETERRHWRRLLRRLAGALHYAEHDGDGGSLSVNRDRYA